MPDRGGTDGGDVQRLGLRGKPAPDGFLEAAARLGAAPGRSVVVEDALAGGEELRLAPGVPAVLPEAAELARAA